MTERSTPAPPAPDDPSAALPVVPVGTRIPSTGAPSLPSSAAGALDRAALRRHLVASRIAGDVATPREANLSSYRKLAQREPYAMFGLEPEGAWTAADVLELMAARCGVVADPGHTSGQDTIDPDLTLDRLDDVADRLRLAVERGERVMFATGHPTGLLALYLPLARALAAAGCEVVRPAAGAALPPVGRQDADERFVRYVEGVAMLGRMGDFIHTHSPLPMRTVLAEPAAVLPDLVVGDHGWAGAAGQAGLDAVGFADCNDPGLFVGEAEGRLVTAVPLDDNVQPYLYEPLVHYLMKQGGL